MPSSSRSASRVLLAGVLALLAVLATTGPASAHAYVETYVPADGAVLDAAPRELRVTFDEEVRAPLAALKVYDLGSERVDLDDAAIAPGDAKAVVGHVPADLGPGTYVVTWRAISTDDHTVIGSYTFTISDAGSAAGAVVVADDDAAVAAAVAAVATDVGAAGAMRGRLVGALRGATLLSTLLLAGGGLVGLVLLRTAAPGWAPARAALRRRLRPLAAVAAAATLADLVVTGLDQAGTGALDALVGGAVDEVLLSAVGLAGLVRLVLLLPVAAGVDLRNAAPVPTGLVLVGPLLTQAVDGHPLADAGLLGVAGDLVHVLAAALWTGGLLAVVLALRDRGPATAPGPCAWLLGRFSTLAAASLAGVAVTGTALAVALHGLAGPAGLLRSDHGRVLAVKVVLVAVAGLLGLANRRLLPRLAVGPSGGLYGAAPVAVTSTTLPAVAHDRQLVGVGATPRPPAASRHAPPAAHGPPADGPRDRPPTARADVSTDTAPGWRRVRRTLLVEVVVLLAVGLLSTRLATADLASAPAEPPAAVATFQDGSSVAVGFVRRAGEDRVIVEARFDATIHDATDVVARLQHVGTGATTELWLGRADPRTRAAFLDLAAVPGDWRVAVEVGSGRFDLDVAETVVPLVLP